MGLAKIEDDFGQFMRQMSEFHQQRTAGMNQQGPHFEARQRHKQTTSRALGTS